MPPHKGALPEGFFLSMEINVCTHAPRGWGSINVQINTGGVGLRHGGSRHGHVASASFHFEFIRNIVFPSPLRRRNQDIWSLVTLIRAPPFI